LFEQQPQLTRYVYIKQTKEEWFSMQVAAQSKYFFWLLAVCLPVTGHAGLSWSWIKSRVARWYIFKPKIPIWVKNGGP
jgi:hypothetical protein